MEPLDVDELTRLANRLLAESQPVAAAPAPDASGTYALPTPAAGGAGPAAPGSAQGALPWPAVAGVAGAPGSAQGASPWPAVAGVAGAPGSAQGASPWPAVPAAPGLPGPAPGVLSSALGASPVPAVPGVTGATMPGSAQGAWSAPWSAAPDASGTYAFLTPAAPAPALPGVAGPVAPGSAQGASPVPAVAGAPGVPGSALGASPAPWSAAPDASGTYAFFSPVAPAPAVPGVAGPVAPGSALGASPVPAVSGGAGPVALGSALGASPPAGGAGGPGSAASAGGAGVPGEVESGAFASPASPGGYYFVDGPAAASSLGSFDVHAVRREFPILSERVNGRQLVWLDNAATTQKPRAVIDRLSRFYEHENSNVHRAAHELAARSTDAYEGARATVARFLGAASADEIVWTRGTTEAINLVAETWGRANVGEGDEILVTHLEHHANIVPWKLLADGVGARLRVVPVDDTGQVRLDALPGLLSERTKLVAVAQVSNALGTVVPVEAFVAAARAVGARVLVDGAQSVAHLAVDVRALDVDFFVFSGHKVFAPTGIGALYGKAEVLEPMPPWQGGGNMIRDVTFESVAFADPPTRFEAGTGNIADAVGLGAALDWLERLGLGDVAAYEHALLDYATSALASVPGLHLLGTAPNKASVLSFTLDGHDPIAVGQALNREGIAVRAGHHCAQPILRRFGHEATVRASLALYNTCDEVDRLVAVLDRLSRRR